MSLLTKLHAPARPGSRRPAALLAAVAVLAIGLSACNQPPPNPGPLRDVVIVGNAVDGTVSFLDGTTFVNLGTVNAVPDLQARLDEINADLIRAIAYPIIKSQQTLKHREPGVGAAAGDRLIDDLYISPDGKTLYVSRANLGDIAALDLSRPGQPIKWRTRVAGLKADHATLSADGTRFVVSATTDDSTQVFNTADGALIGQFKAGHYPHQNDYSANGNLIYNASIGNVASPFAESANKGARQLTIADANTFAIQRAFKFMKRQPVSALDPTEAAPSASTPEVEWGIRPAVITPDGTTMYAQLSYHSSLFKLDLTDLSAPIAGGGIFDPFNGKLYRGKITKRLDLPASTVHQLIYPTFDDYPHDSAQHGLAMSADGTKLCAAGTIDDNVSIVNVADLTLRNTVAVGELPYWSTTSVDGNFCIVSNAGSRSVSVIDYRTGAEVKRTTVGTYPARSRTTKVPSSYVGLLAAPPTA